MTYNFKDFKKDSLEKARDKAWGNWAKFDKVGDKVQGFIRDVFYRQAEGLYKAQRGITLEQANGELINVAIKREPAFILSKTNSLRLGDPLTVVFESELPAKQKGFSKTKVLAFYGTNLEENAGQKTVKELDEEDRLAGGTTSSQVEEEGEDIKEEEIDF